MVFDPIRLGSALFALGFLAALYGLTLSVHWNGLWRALMGSLATYTALIALFGFHIPVAAAAILLGLSYVVICVSCPWADLAVRILNRSAPTNPYFKRTHARYQSRLDQFYRSIYFSMAMGTVVALIWVGLNWRSGQPYLFGTALGAITFLTVVPLFCGSRDHSRLATVNPRTTGYDLSSTQAKDSSAWEVHNSLVWFFFATTVSGGCYLLEFLIQLIVGLFSGDPNGATLAWGLIAGVLFLVIAGATAVYVNCHEDKVVPCDTPF